MTSSRTRKGRAAEPRAARRPAGVWLKLPSLKQSRAMCGPACLRIVAHHFGIEVSEAVLARACRTSRVSGTTGANLVRGARWLGLEATIIDHGTFRRIEASLRRGRPVIVDWMSTFRPPGARESVAQGHYSVVRGLTAQHIHLQDPQRGGRRRLSRETFRNLWFDFRLERPRSRDDLIIRRMIVIARTEEAGRPVRRPRSR